jgi:S1-C subfamily serine protease
VLRTDAKLAKWVTVRPYDDIKVGERAITIGTPQGLELTAAEGIVSSKRLYNQTRVVQTSAPISQGSSGGGLFDARGHLLGITTFYFRGGQNLNFAVAAEEYAQEREESATR